MLVAHAVFGGGIGVVVDVQLGDRHLLAQFLGQFLEEGCRQSRVESSSSSPREGSSIRRQLAHTARGSSRDSYSTINKDIEPLDNIGCLQQSAQFFRQDVLTP